MANYQISYLDSGSNVRTIDLLPGDDGVRIEWRTEMNRNMGSTGIIENVIQNTLRYVSFDCYFQESAFYKLETFMSFAQQGQEFAFTKDTNKSTLYTLSADVTVGDSSLSINEDATLELAAGDYIYIADSYGTKWDIGEVDTPHNGSIDLVETTQHSYSSTTGYSNISWCYYFANLYLMDESFDPDRSGAFWHHTFNCVEVRNVS